LPGGSIGCITASFAGGDVSDAKRAGSAERRATQHGRSRRAYGGAGATTWLKAFIAVGVTDAIGVDRDYVSHDLLRIDADRFIAADLTKPLDLGRMFDLAVCLEVGEHLSEDAGRTPVPTSL
jgi:hypothetical protein